MLKALIEKMSVDYATISPEDKYALLIDIFENRQLKQAMEYITNGENKFTELMNLDTGCIKIGISSTLTKEFLLPYLPKNQLRHRFCTLQFRPLHF